MSDRAWRVDELEDESPSATPPSPALVTMHFLLTALRRRWRVWAAFGCVGILLGLGWALSFPPKTVGTVTVVLAHEPSADPQQAISTDVSLLRTRTLAVDVIEELGLDMTPEEFQSTVVSLPVSTDVLILEVSGPDAVAAVARAGALADAYLAFRASQMKSQLEGQTRGYKKRLSTLREQSEDLEQQYDETRASSRGEQQAAALLNKQAQVASEIEEAQQSIEDATLVKDSVIDASSVLDPASRKPPPSRIKAALLAIASGLIGATAVGAGLVLVTALMSNRLRLREEVALALDAPVPVSVAGRIRASWWPFQQIRLPAASVGLLVDALDREVSRPPKRWPPAAGSRKGGQHGTTRRMPPTHPPGAPGRRTHLALATVDTGDAGQLVMAGLATRLAAEGMDVFVVDLTEQGDLELALNSALDHHQDPASRSRPVVYRPDRVPSLERGPLDSPTPIAADRPSAAPWPDAWETADVTLTLGEVDHAVGVEHLRSWADEAVVLVAAGRSSAERLSTTGDLIRSAGLRLLFGMMVGTDRTDETLGLPEDAYRAWPRLARQSS
jgi:capsular polysaccharide biosynthesis protein